MVTFQGSTVLLFCFIFPSNVSVLLFFSFFPPTSVREGIKLVLSVCLCVLLLVSALTLDPFDALTQLIGVGCKVKVRKWGQITD